MAVQTRQAMEVYIVLCNKISRNNIVQKKEEKGKSRVEVVYLLFWYGFMMYALKISYTTLMYIQKETFTLGTISSMMATVSIIHCV